MIIILHSLIVVACIIGLWFGAVLIVNSASKIAKRLGVSELVIGLTVVAIATSAPEFAVSVSAALSGHSEISVANVIGSDIFNLGIILGIVLLFSNIKTTKTLLYRDGFVLLASGIIVSLFFINSELSRIEGIILLSSLVIYILILLYYKDTEVPDIPKGIMHWYDIPLLIIGLVIVITGGHFFTQSASAIAKEIGISEWVIGITIVGAGTSAPEMATSIVAATKKKFDMSAGTLIGSDIFNILGVLGVASIFNPLSLSEKDFLNLLILILFYIILLFLIRYKWRLNRNDGIILIIFALIRWLFAFIV